MLKLIRILSYKHPFLRKLLYPAIIIKRSLLNRKRRNVEILCENFSAILAEDPILYIDEFQGFFKIGIHSDLFKRIIAYKRYEPKIAQFCLKYLNKNRDAIDIGANVGFYTILFAKNLDKRRVLSIEPTANTLQRLYKNVEINRVKENVIVYEGVAINYTGKAEIKIIEGKEEYSSIGEIKHPSVFGSAYISKKVNCTTVDKLVKQYSLDIGFVKIDVEGAEHIVFEGCKELLKFHRPIIISEISERLLKLNGSSSKDLINFILQCDYDIVDPIDPKIPPGFKDSGDLLCIPKEMRQADIP
jgi:FkbM family methyltransferase